MRLSRWVCVCVEEENQSMEQDRCPEHVLVNGKQILPVKQEVLESMLPCSPFHKDVARRSVNLRFLPEERIHSNVRGTGINRRWTQSGLRHSPSARPVESRLTPFGGKCVIVSTRRIAISVGHNIIAYILRLMFHLLFMLYWYVSLFCCVILYCIALYL